MPAPLTHGPLMADLVLEGGGVKGVALVGAICGLVDAGYSFGRIAGTSAGAIVGAVVAAMNAYGEPLTSLPEVLGTLDLGALADRGRPGDLLGPLTAFRAGRRAADAVNIVLDAAAFRGDRLERWLDDLLKNFGVTTFADLLLDDPGVSDSESADYRLVVMASDLSRKRLARLPWDYPIYHLHPDQQSVATAVRASAATPFVFRPVELPGPLGTATLVDGGLLSNYPVDVFDRHDGRASRWPTIGIRLDALSADTERLHLRPVEGPVALGLAVIETAIDGNQAEHLLSLSNQARSIHVPADGIGSFDFSLTDSQRSTLFENGYRAASEFLSREALSR
ncbi:MAG: patatin-like phospholipase family protein [Marmoricola sp.]